MGLAWSEASQGVTITGVRVSAAVNNHCALRQREGLRQSRLYSSTSLHSAPADNNSCSLKLTSRHVHAFDVAPLRVGQVQESGTANQHRPPDPKVGARRRSHLLHHPLHLVALLLSERAGSPALFPYTPSRITYTSTPPPHLSPNAGQRAYDFIPYTLASADASMHRHDIICIQRKR